MKRHIITFLCSLILHLMLLTGLELLLRDQAADYPTEPSLLFRLAPDRVPEPRPRALAEKGQTDESASQGNGQKTFSQKKRRVPQPLSAEPAMEVAEEEPSKAKGGESAPRKMTVAAKGEAARQKTATRGGTIRPERENGEKIGGDPPPSMDMDRIRQMIQKRMIYPLLARKKGWSGRVMVSFRIEKDGAVSDIRVLASSGFGVLDDDAVHTVARAAPFPAPAEATRIVVPITYQLGGD